MKGTPFNIPPDFFILDDLPARRGTKAEEDQKIKDWFESVARARRISKNVIVIGTPHA